MVYIMKQFLYQHLVKTRSYEVFAEITQFFCLSPQKRQINDSTISRILLEQNKDMDKEEATYLINFKSLCTSFARFVR